jgi:hypothetical protein
MKYIKTLISAVIAVVLCTTVVSAATSTNSPVVVTPTGDLGPWTLSLSGGGQSALNNDKGNNSAIGATFDVGYSVGKVVFPIETGVRQFIGYSDVNSSQWILSTEPYADWVLYKVKSFEFDAGANIGYVYGDTPSTWAVAPEAIGRVYLKKDVDFFGRIEYPYNLNDGRTENSLLYSIGLRVRF